MSARHLAELRSVPVWIRAWVIIGIGFIAALTLPAVRLPSDESSLRRFPIEIDANMTLSQTFVMAADEFYAVEVSAFPANEAVSGDVRFALYDVTDGGRLARRADVPAADVVRKSVYRFEFAPIAKETRDQIYRLDVQASPSHPAQGVALWATKGAGYDGGSLFINERERWADLTFATFARGGRSPWRRLMEASSPRLGARFSQIVVVAVAGYWLALGIVLRAWLRWSAASSS
jgi:hypothetical protein